MVDELGTTSRQQHEEGLDALEHYLNIGEMKA